VGSAAVTGSARTVWRVAGVPAGVFVLGIGRKVELEVSVGSAEPAVVAAIETAAERAGVVLERVDEHGAMLEAWEDFRARADAIEARREARRA
jgi:hypothetical protein